MRVKDTHYLEFRQILFVFFFSVLMLCQFLLGETYLGTVTGGMLVVFLSFFFFQRNFRDHSLESSTKIVISWVFYIFFMLISSFFSHSLPQTLDSIFFTLVSFMVFIFFLKMPSQFLNKKFVLSVFILIGIVLLILSFGIRINPHWSLNLPGMNIIYETYGHNHLASFIIIINPLILLLHFHSNADSNLHKKFLETFFQYKSIFLYLIFNLFLLTTFARVAILIGFLQLFYFFFFLNTFKKFHLFKGTKILLFGLGVLYVSVISLKLFFSVVQIIRPSFDCPIFPTKLCKNIGKDLRAEYWRQSLVAIKEHPLFGYGPGTFSLISNKYKSAPYSYSAYAHNSILHTMSEKGVLAGASFLLLFLFFFLKVFSAQKKQFRPFSVFTLIAFAVFSSFLDSLFDFSWSFSGLFFVVVILMALSLKEMDSSSIEKRVSRRPEFFLGVVWIVFSVGTFIYWVIFSANEILISQNKLVKAFDGFPFFYSQHSLFLKSKELSSDQKERFQKIYQYDSAVYSFPSTNVDVNNSLFVIDPWKVAFATVQNPDSLQELHLSAGTILKLIQFIEHRQKQDNTSVFSFQQKKTLTSKTLDFADELLKKGDAETAGELYAAAHSLVSFSIQDHQQALVLDDNGKWIQFLSKLANIAPNDFGVQNAYYTDLYFKIANGKLVNNAPSEALPYAMRGVELTPYATNSLWNSFSEKIKVRLDFYLSQKNKKLARETVSLWIDFKEFITKERKLEVDFQAQDELAHSLVTVAHLFVDDDFDYLLKNYQQAIEIDPTIFNNEIHFLDHVDINNLDPNQAKKYFDLFESLYPRIAEGRKVQSYQLLLNMCFDFYQHSQFADAEKYLGFANRFSFVDLETKEEFIKQKQMLADEYVEKGEIDQALRIIRFMNLVQPNDFWIAQQPGNLFLYLGKNAEMEKEYQICLEAFHSNHEDCQNKGYQDTQRFFKVSQIIRGEKEWFEVLE